MLLLKEWAIYDNLYDYPFGISELFQRYVVHPNKRRKAKVIKIIGWIGIRGLFLDRKTARLTRCVTSGRSFSSVVTGITSIGARPESENGQRQKTLSFRVL